MDSVTVLLASVDLVSMSAHVRTLQNEGFNVITAFNGKDLIDSLDRHLEEITMIISDVRLPGVEFYDVSDFISLRRDDTLPIVGIADFDHDEEVLLNAGETFTSLLGKGFSSEELLATVNSLIESLEIKPRRGLTKEEISERAALFSETQVVNLNEEDLEELARARLRNSAHQHMLDDIENQ